MIVGRLCLILSIYYHFQCARAIITEIWKSGYDYIIVGGGTAGLVLANRLSEDPQISVLVLEAGPDPSDDPFVSVPYTAKNLTENSKLTWNFVTEDQPYLRKDKKLYWKMGKMLGGSSCLNSLLVTRGSAEDYNKWSEMGNKNWSYNDVLPYFKKSEDTIDTKLASNGFHGIGGPIPIRTDHKEPIIEELLKSVKELGFNENPDYNGPYMEGFGWGQITLNEKGQRSSTLESFLRPVLARRNLDVVTDAHVRKVLIEDFYFQKSIKIKRSKSCIPTAKGVLFQHGGNIHYVKARKEVIVSAGPVNSPQILMLSGIGPRRHLNKMGIKVIKDLPVGANLQDQPAMFFPIRISDTSPIQRKKIFTFEALFEYLFTGNGIWSTPFGRLVSFHKSGTQSTKDLFPYIEHIFNQRLPWLPEDIVQSIRNGSKLSAHLLRELQTLDNAPWSIMASLAHLHPRTTGTITLRNTNPLSKPVINYTYLDKIADIQDLLEGVRRIQQIIKTTVMQNAKVQPLTCPGSECLMERYDTDAYWECCIRHNTYSFNHQVGSCKMSNDASGVVDDKLRVKGVNSLRIVDSSIMPLITSGHTYIPTIMIAEKAADLIKQSNH